MALEDGAAHPIAFDQAVGATHRRHAARLHGLHLAVAHAGEIGADEIAGALQHPLLAGETEAVEALAPWQAGVRIDGDRRVETANLGSELGSHLLDQLRGRLGLADAAALRRAGVQPHQVQIVGWQLLAG